MSTDPRSTGPDTEQVRARHTDLTLPAAVREGYRQGDVPALCDALDAAAAENARLAEVIDAVRAMAEGWLADGPDDMAIRILLERVQAIVGPPALDSPATPKVES